MINYSMASASMEPKELMVQALRKCILNNKIIIKKIEEGDSDFITQRVNNSLRLIEVMKGTLNLESDNPTVFKTLGIFQWLSSELEDINENWEKDKDLYKEKTSKLNPVLNDLVEGFKELKDE